MASDCSRPGALSLDSVLLTEELARRPSRRPDHEAENRALAELVTTLATSPRSILQKLVEVARDACHADSAGISLLSKDDGGKTFVWPAVTGPLSPYVGGGTPRDFGPCGVVLDRDSMQLFTHPERVFHYLAPIQPPLEEVLLTPFYVDGQAVGTVWLVSHRPSRKFDAEDLRFIETLGAFASAAYQTLERLDALEMDRRALQESERRFRSFADAAPAMLWVTEVDDSCSFLSRGWYEFTGQREAEALGFGWLGAVHPDDQERSASIFRDASSRREPFALEYRLRRHDGVYRWALDAGRPRFDAGLFVGFVGSVIDIDERKAAEEQQQRLAQQLRLADQRKDEFLAMLAHELRNPLAPIRTAAALLRRASGEDRTDRWIQIISRQTAQMGRLIDDLLDVSRISRGTIEIQAEPIDLGPLVQQTVEMALAQFETAGVDLTVTVPAAPIVIHADPTRLAQVVANLLNNAVKFTNHGGHVDVEVGSSGNLATITIVDDGIGIAPAELDRVFEIFVQIDSSVARSRGGLGLGLTLVKTLVQLHGGTVHVSSAGLGRGAAFTVSLPTVDAMPVNAPRDARQSQKPVAARRVLVVDDNVDSAEMLSEFLRAVGHDVRVAHAGMEAVRICEEFEPDVAFLDLGLPEISGYDVAREIRRQHRTKRVFLAALTGWGQETDRQRSAAAGFDLHLLKPLDPDAIVRVVSNARSSAAAPETADHR